MMNVRVVIIIGFSYLYGFFEAVHEFETERKKYGYNFGRQRESMVVVHFHYDRLLALSFSIGATRIGRLKPGDAFFAAGIGIGPDRVGDQDPVHRGP